MIRHLIWDWNGTLLDDRPALADAVNAAMAAVGLPKVSEDFLRARFARPLHALYRSVTGLADDDLWTAWHDAFVKQQEQSQGFPHLAADAMAAVKSWNAPGGSQSVVSNWPEATLGPMIRAAGLIPPIGLVRGTRQEYECKADILQDLVSDNKLNPDEVVVIGDTIADAEAAAAVGARAVLCDTCSFAPIAPVHIGRYPTASNLLEAIELVRRM